MIIIQQKSAKGVSLMATLQELLTYSITLSRSYRRDLPFRYEAKRREQKRRGGGATGRWKIEGEKRVWSDKRGGLTVSSLASCPLCRPCFLKAPGASRSLLPCSWLLLSSLS